MTATQSLQGLSVRRFFAGKGVLVTGSTGFLAKALVEKLLRDLPEVKKIHLLIRPRARADGSLVDPAERMREEILRNSAFSRLREKMGARFESWCQERIACVSGDLTHPRLGLSEEAFEALAREVQIVIGSAATVVFDERLDLALEINTLSPQRLLELAQAAGGAYIHISTAYVSGMRKGLVPESLLDPLEAIDAQLPPGAPRPDKFDVAKEIEKLRTLAKIVTSDCETQARKQGWAPESEEARTALRRALVSAGMRRARSLGWNDTYTYTKFLGEQLVRDHHGAVPTAIVRPSIIESSLR
ncbi:MAG: SDR family oxidoreductase [Planctomycetes bacterium]|nr:SDR family oxidoreductase [Planctomycetota bacterium]